MLALSLVSVISRWRLKVASTSRRARIGSFSSRGTSMPMSTRWGKAAYSLATSMSQTSLLIASCSGIAVSRSDWPPARMLGLLRTSTSGTSPSALRRRGRRRGACTGRSGRGGPSRPSGTCAPRRAGRRWPSRSRRLDPALERGGAAAPVTGCVGDDHLRWVLGRDARHVAAGAGRLDEPVGAAELDRLGVQQVGLGVQAVGLPDLAMPRCRRRCWARTGSPGR
jgi:hypothetical protein